MKINHIHVGLFHQSHGSIYSIFTYLDLPRGAEWMIRGAEKHHPLGFKQHPLEDAGTCWLNFMGFPGSVNIYGYRSCPMASSPATGTVGI